METDLGTDEVSTSESDKTPSEEPDEVIANKFLNHEFEMPNVDSSVVLEDLDGEMPPRVLAPCDPQKFDNIAYFNHHEKTFGFNDKLGYLVVHFSKNGGLVRRVQPLTVETEDSFHPKSASVVNVEYIRESNEILNTLRNQFEFSDRSCQTSNEAISFQGFSTHPPPSGDHNMTVSTRNVFDAYMHAFSPVEKPATSADPIYSPEMIASSKLMERIVNLNVENDIFGDMKYYEDKSDDYRESGSLLPLWKFVNEKNAKIGLQVTSIKWNPKYSDMFAMSYGSYEFMKQSLGMLAVYSLKNSKSPEILLQADSTICCIDWNKEYPALIAAGMYDGSIGVLDVRKPNKFIFHSNVVDKKHLDPVWEVVWTSGSCVKSVSIDGHIRNWEIARKLIVCEPVLSIKDDPAPLAGSANALCFDFSPFDTDRFLVGTEEGHIHLCLKYLSVQVATWTHAEKMAVYAVKWNPCHTEMLASASADWTVKLWTTKGTCLSVFELGGAVGDLAWWSPFVLAAVTAEGSVCVFDLERNRNKEVCSQRILKRGKLTRLAINPGQPAVLVGDDRGVAYCLKLSPNLRGNRRVERTTEEDLIHLEAIIKLLS